MTKMSLTLSSPALLLGEHMSDATLLLNAVEQGDAKAAGKLLALVYDDLRNLN
jgi:hypothetical protein